MENVVQSSVVHQAVDLSANAYQPMYMLNVEISNTTTKRFGLIHYRMLTENDEGTRHSWYIFETRAGGTWRSKLSFIPVTFLG